MDFRKRLRGPRLQRERLSLARHEFSDALRYGQRAAALNPFDGDVFGVIGRKAGAAPGYEFSDALKKSGITWDDASLGDYLKDPKAKVPG